MGVQVQDCPRQQHKFSPVQFFMHLRVSLWEFE